jgi:hypothetical protein
MDTLALRLYDVLRQVRVLGPDGDGLLWVQIASAGTTANLALPADHAGAAALTSWRAEAAAVLTAAELEGIR